MKQTNVMPATAATDDIPVPWNEGHRRRDRRLVPIIVALIVTLSACGVSPVSYTHLTLPTIYSV